MPKQPIPKSIATAGLLAHIAQAKYCHHLPLYRQEQIWSELDVRLPRNTLSRWMMSLGEQSQELIELMMEEIKLHGHIHADETPVTVLEKKGSQSSLNKHKGYMWVYTNNKGVVYDYATSRGSEHPAKMLENFTGYLQTDAYTGYDQFESKEIKLVGCFAHARRYFTNVKKAAGKKKNTPRVDYILKQIGKLYKLEKQYKDSKADEIEIYNLRQQEAIPILEKLQKYLNDIKPRVPPESLLGKAISYSLNHWSKLIRYTDNGILNIDNNPAERKIKPFVIGRKNWLFCGNIKGAKASANLYSLIESAKLFNIKIFDYLKYIFENIPLADTPRKLEQLLPQYAHTHLPKNIIKPK
ncbi:MAG: IS66 family transposase [Campylobacterota bacterium]|nr:IS66 family transposase [Campylobacterota bacterium]